MKRTLSLLIESGRSSPVMPSLMALLALLALLSLPVQVSANVPGARKSRIQSIQERAANVKRQLTEHQRFEARAQRELKAPTAAVVPPIVSMQFDKLLKTSSTTFFYDDMESGTNGWSAVSPSDPAAWHQTTLDANSPTHSWWPGIEAQGNYATGARVYEQLISPAINLSGATGNVTLLFTENYFTERGFDFCMVDATTDGGATWTHLRGGYGESPSGDTYGWKVSTLDLTAYANQTINLRFVFDTGDSLFNAFPGWFVDNVAVFDQSETVKGIVFYDQNQNGTHDSGEWGLANWLVTVTGPLTLTMPTSQSGTFNLPLPLGSYQFSEALQPPWTETTPSTISVDLNTPAGTVNDVNFGNYRLGCLLSGNVFEDLNKDSLFTPGEPPFTDPWIVLSDSTGSWVNDAQPDSSGQFAFFAFGAGRYQLTEYLPPHWVSTVPGGRLPTYNIMVPPKDTVFSGFIFGSYQVPPTNSAIRGFAFNDLNRNGVPDDREPPIQNRLVSLNDSLGLYGATTFTDSLGRFSFENLTAEGYTVSLQGICGWQQSVPAGNYNIELDSGQVIDSIMFGSYQYFPGSISGTVYNDLNADGVRAPGEPGIGGFMIYLSGATCGGAKSNQNVKMSTACDDSGHYRFDGLLLGTYHIRIALTAHWRQTQPASLQPYTIALGGDASRPGTDFGLTYDSSFNLAYRSFLPETIAYVNDNIGRGHPGLALKVKAIGSEATFTLITPIGGLNGLHVEFSQTIDTSSFTISRFPPGTPAVGLKKWEFKLEGSDTLGKGDSVVIFGACKVGKMLLISKYWWEKGNLKTAPGTSIGKNLSGSGRLLLPMPNVMNVLQTMYSDGMPTKYGLTVGLVPNGHSAYANSAANVWKSLYQNGHTHQGHPRCLGVFSTTLGSIKTPVNTLTPTKGNNILFAEALALKANLFASQFEITPYGFGGLIFHGDTANPFNGLSVMNIAKKLDSAISKYVEPTKKPVVAPGYCVCDTNYFNVAYRTIRMIDSAFSGPMDTISFGPGLILKPVRDLSTVPFLTLDSSFSSLSAGTVPIKGSYMQEPLQYKLEQNYPNPFNPTTTISFTLAQGSFVTLKIYNILGQEVATVFNREQMNEGPQEFEFNASNLASGVYFYRIKAEGIADPDNNIAGQTFVAVKKMVLLK